MSIFAKCNTVRYMRKKAQEVLLRLIFTAFLRINSCHFSILKHLVYGGPNGELGASLRYLSQRFSMPNDMTKALLTDIGNCYPKFYFRPQKKYVPPKSLSNIHLYRIYCVLQSYLKSLLQWSR